MPPLARPRGHQAAQRTTLERAAAAAARYSPKAVLVRAARTARGWGRWALSPYPRAARTSRWGGRPGSVQGRGHTDENPRCHDNAPRCHDSNPRCQDRTLVATITLVVTAATATSFFALRTVRAVPLRERTMRISPSRAQRALRPRARLWGSIARPQRRCAPGSSAVPPGDREDARVGASKCPSGGPLEQNVTHSADEIRLGSAGGVRGRLPPYLAARLRHRVVVRAR